ncbi:MAG: 4-hydroxythreonine-4-phosphate dehydrogenase PdxA [Tepidisphaeraceae bacterium]|jgi:hypothetical protein
MAAYTLSIRLSQVSQICWRGGFVFLRAKAGQFDAGVAMYNSQGLISVILLAFDQAVDMTIGLPIPIQRGVQLFASFRGA